MNPVTTFATRFVLQFDITDLKCGINGFCEIPNGQQGDIQATEGLHLHAGFGIDFRYGVNLDCKFIRFEVGMYRNTVQ